MNIYIHEQWFLLINAKNKIIPEVFQNFTLFNISLTLVALLALIGWVGINFLYPEKEIVSRFRNRFSTFCLRLFFGFFLIVCALGLCPKEGVSLFHPVLFAPDLLVNQDIIGNMLIVLELIAGILLLLGIWVRCAAVIIILLLILSLFIYKKTILQYTGFYLGGAIFLLIDEDQTYFYHRLKLFILQCLMGINFIYSAISIKLLHPYIDIQLLRQQNALTLVLSYSNFTYLMFIVEVLFGVLFILGYRLSFISVLLFLVFIFMSYNLSENFLYHSFIYGPLFVFVLLNGTPFIKVSRGSAEFKSKHRSKP